MVIELTRVGGGAGDGSMVNRDELPSHAEIFARHAEAVQGYAQTCSGGIAGLSLA